MKEESTSFFKLTLPFKVLGKGTKKIAIGVANFWKNDELQELLDSLDEKSKHLTLSLEKIKKSAEQYREHSEVIKGYKNAEQNLEDISNEIAGKNKELEGINIETGHSTCLQNGTWQNRIN